MSNRVVLASSDASSSSSSSTAPPQFSLSRLVEVLQMATVNEMRHFLLALQLKRLRMRAASTSRARPFRLRVAAMVAVASALVCATQQFRVAGALLLLSVWDGLVGLPNWGTQPPESGSGDRHQLMMMQQEPLARWFTRSQRRDAAQVGVVAVCLTTAVAAHVGGWGGATPLAATSTIASLVTGAVLATTAFSVAFDASVLALTALFAPAVAAVQNGCLRSRLLMHMCVWERHADGDEGAFVERLAGRTADLEWRAIWLTTELNRSKLRQMLCDRALALLEGLRAAINMELTYYAISLVSNEQIQQMQQMQQMPQMWETPEAGEKRCMQWLRTHGARIEDAWWGAEEETCSVCLCGLREATTTATTLGNERAVASYPCCTTHAHAFHAKCLAQWLARHTNEATMTCPLCRSGPML